MQVHVGMYHYTVCSLCDLFTFKNKTTEPGFLQAQFVHSSMEDDIQFDILSRLNGLIFSFEMKKWGPSQNLFICHQALNFLLDGAQQFPSVKVTSMRKTWICIETL